MKQPDIQTRYIQILCSANARFSNLILGASLIAAVLGSAVMAQDADKFPPTRWESDIAKFEKQDAAKPFPADETLFVGSSSIRLWDLEKGFPNRKTLNRGFGGCFLSDVVYYFDRIILPYHPKAIVVYAGDNDIGSGRTKDQVIESYKTLASLVHEQLPKAHLIFVPIKPSIKRWALWPEMKAANDAIAAIAEKNDWQTFVDIAPPMLGEDGKPRPELFVADGLHMSPAGYAIWNEFVEAILKNVADTPAKNSKDVSAVIPDRKYDYQWAWDSTAVAEAGEKFWPQFRGPTGDGMAAAGCTPPIQWSESENIVWKIELPGRAWSSPTVWGNQIWMLNATADGVDMSALCVDLETGSVVHDIQIFHNEQVQPDHHDMNSYGSPTPVLDESNAYVEFGAYGAACINRKSGKIIWTRTDLKCNHFRGPGSSPVLYHNLLIYHMDGFDNQFVVALDKYTGKTAWKVDREIDYGTENGDYYKAFSTPMLINVDGHDELISSTSKATLAYDPANGREIWRVRYDGFSATAKPLFDGDVLYLNTGFGKANLLAVRKGGLGDVTDSHVLWKQIKGIGSKPSQLLYNSLIFNIEDKGVASCLDASNGEIVWQKRLDGLFSSSPVIANGHFYVFDHDGKAYVFAADKESKLLSENSLGDGCMASPAVIGNSLIVRTRTALYRIAAK